MNRWNGLIDSCEAIRLECGRLLSQKKKSPNAYDALTKPIREALDELGFNEPTMPQVAAIPSILKNENVLLIAPTGSGKTEAVILPIFSNFLQQEDKHGISIIYITPLRALNRDMVKRLSFWASKLDMTIEVRHGDTEMKIRRRQALKPPNMLVTTPETLQAILPGTLMQQHLSHVRYVIVDEVHELAEDKRGTQLTIALERLRELTKQEFQRIGLSATVGNPEKVAGFIAGSNRPVKIIEVPLPKGYHYSVECPQPEDPDFDLAQKLYTAPEAAARIRRILDLVKQHTSTLVFVNSRANAETLGHKFTQLQRSDIAVHHGSLSRQERARIEDEFKAKALKAIVCTSTLELGIDIGHVDLVIQYLSPRQVSNLIQRVGRSGHRLDLVSEGIIITAFPDDTMEAITAVKKAHKGELEPLRIHEGALDVLAHQIVGTLMDKREITVDQALRITRRAYPYRDLTREQFLHVAKYLHNLREVWYEEGTDTLKRSKRTREYYYENLSMIPDERRYPVVDVLTDRTIGTVGDEFMALRARIGLTIILHGKVWRIVQIEDETGTVHAVPAEDPFAALPGWDGEILPVPYSLALEVGKLRQQITEELQKQPDSQKVAEKLAKKLSTDKTTLLESTEEIQEQIKQGAPVPTDSHILIEGYDKYLVIHACYGELVNRTLGAIFDAILSDNDLITGWWNDGYRILIEMPRKAEQQDIDKLPNMLFNLADEEVDKAFNDYVKARFPFSYKMKFIAERFGALPRGKTMSYEKMAQIASRFQKTPIYEETIREAMQEKVDIPTVKTIMHSIKQRRTQVSTLLRHEKPTPMGYRILSKYSEIPELMAPEKVIQNNIERMKKAIQARKPSLLCLNCGTHTEQQRLHELPDHPTCPKCHSGLLADLHPFQDPTQVIDILKRRLKDQQLAPDELEQLTHARRTADLVLSHGKKALIAFQVKGIGPETAFRILGKMHPNENDYYTDLLKAKIQYLRTRPYWENKEETH